MTVFFYRSHSVRVQVSIPTRTIPTSTIPTLTIPTRTCVTDPDPDPNPTCATCRPRRRAPPKQYAYNRPTIVTLVGMVAVGMVPAPILYGSLLRNNKKEDFVTVLVAQAK